MLHLRYRLRRNKGKFYERLVAREYDPNYLNPLFAIEYSRSNLLTANNSKKLKTIPIVFKLPNTPRFTHSDIQSLLHVPETLLDNPHFQLLFQGKQPIIAYTRPKNLKEILVNNKEPK